jgi:hypothetical protein
MAMAATLVSCHVTWPGAQLQRARNPPQSTDTLTSFVHYHPHRTMSNYLYTKIAFLTPTAMWKGTVRSGRMGGEPGAGLGAVRQVAWFGKCCGRVV